MVEEDPSSSEKPNFEKSQIEHGRHLFAQECQFFHGTDTLKNLPEASLPEVDFVGRSNAGKSSLINALILLVMGLWGYLESLSPTAMLQSNGIVISLPPMSSTIAGALKDSM